MPVSAIRKLTPYAVKAKSLGVKVYHLNIGDPDVLTPEVMLDALHRWSINPIGYAPSNGDPEFIAALTWYYQKLGFSSVGKEQIMATVGGSEALVMTLYAVCDAGDEIVVFEPYYSNYAVCAAYMGVSVKSVKTVPENGFHLPKREEIEKSISSKTKAIILCNPNNPTGTVYTKEEVEMMVAIAKDKNLFLISDEVYREYLFDGKKHISLLSYTNSLSDRIIVLDSLSKRYSLCGARLGVIVSFNTELLTRIMKIAQGRLSGGLIDQKVGAKLTEVPDQYIESVRVEYEKRRDVIYKGLKKIKGVTLEKPEGAFYAMATLPVDDSEKFCIFLLSEFRDNNETVMFAPGAGFYQTPGLGTKEIRIAYVLNTQSLERAIAILDKALTAYNAKKTV